MKKKIFVIIAVIIMIAVLGFFAAFARKAVLDLKAAEEARIAEQKRQEELIAKINEKYGPFANGEKVETDEEDKLANYFNNIFIIHKAIEELKTSTVTIKDISNLDTSINKLKKNKVDAETLVYESIDEYIKDYEIFEKEAISVIYSKNEIIKNIEDDYSKRDKYIESVDKNLNILQFFKDNKSQYTIENNKIIYYYNDFLPKFKELNIDLPIAKMDYGKEIPILMYHGVSDTPWGASSLFQRVSDFEAQMKYLHDEGFTTLFLTEIGSAKNYDKPIIITFDDGYIDMYTTAYPIMKKYNIKSNMYIITRWLDGSTYMTEDMVRALDNSGLVQIGSHTLDHVYLATKSYDEQEVELRESASDLERILGHSVNTIAYPYGSRNTNTLKIAKDYYRYAVTTDDGYNYEKTYNSYSLILKRKNITRGMSLNTYKVIVNGTK